MCRRSQAGWISPEEIARMQAKRGDEAPPMTEDVRILSNSYNKIGRFDLQVLSAPGRNGEPRVIFVIPLYFVSLLILLLPERKFLNIIPAVAEHRQRRSLAWVDVLYNAVETRATTTRLRSFSPVLKQRREIPEFFLLEGPVDARQEQFVHML